MICYLVTREHAYTMGSYLKSWGSAFAERIAILSYDYVFDGKTLPIQNTTWVFSDLDRLSAPQRDSLGALHDYLVTHRGAARVLNDPSRLKLRLELLQTLQQQGINHFNACRVTDGATSLRYPLFIRPEAGFTMQQPPMLNDADDYRRAVADMRRAGDPLDDAIAVEFHDTADAHGIFRKYGAFVVGDRIVPRHLFFSRKWLVKFTDLDDPALLAEEDAYIDDNPHEDILRYVARLAGARYGRIDYSLDEGRPQIWEINSNPMISLATDISGVKPARRASHRGFMHAFGAALDALDSGEA